MLSPDRVPKGLLLCSCRHVVRGQIHESREALVRALCVLEGIADLAVLCVNNAGTLTEYQSRRRRLCRGSHAKFSRNLSENQGPWRWIKLVSCGEGDHPHNVSLDQTQLNTTLAPELREQFNSVKVDIFGPRRETMARP
jgi:hypothetical protein